ncbi:hypothetical protein BG000_009701 [Podila horticola]|nr:hypothetical protein BG000_009701 [Podila horticola]
MKKTFGSILRALIPSRKGSKSPAQKAQESTQAPPPTKVDNSPGLIAQPFYTFNDRQLIIVSANVNPYKDFRDNNFTDGIYSLDLSVAWPASEPAWTKLARSRVDVMSTIGPVILNKEGSTLYHFNFYSMVHKYNVREAEWSPPEPKDVSQSFFGITAVLDSDMDRIFGTGRTVAGNWNLTTCDPTTNTVSVVSENILEQVGRGLKAYSSARKSLFFLHTEGPTTLYEYNIASDSWTTVVCAGDIPSPLYGGTKLVAVGGKRKIEWERNVDPEIRDNLVLSDIYMFDVETSVWTKETTTPVGYTAAACATSGDHLVLYGGYSVSKDPSPDVDGDDFVCNSTTSIYNMKTRTWVSTYTPS